MRADAIEREDELTLISSGVADQNAHVIIDDGGGSSTSYLFSMKAAEVHDLLTSYDSGKRIVISELPDDIKSIRYAGTLFHTQAGNNNYKIYFGICFLSFTSGNFEPVDKHEVSSGQTISTYEFAGSIDDIHDPINLLLQFGSGYYGFIKSECDNSSSYVYGNLHFYASTIEP